MDMDIDTSGTGAHLSIRRCIGNLLHACRCRFDNCPETSCDKMKRVVAHAKECTARMTSGGCPVCKQLVALCCYHAKHCQDANCPVSFCAAIKRKLMLQQANLQLQQNNVLRRQVQMTMQMRRNGNGTPTAPSAASRQPEGPDPSMVQGWIDSVRRRQQQEEEEQQAHQGGPGHSMFFVAIIHHDSHEDNAMEDEGSDSEKENEE